MLLKTFIPLKEPKKNLKPILYAMLVLLSNHWSFNCGIRLLLRSSVKLRM